MTGRQTGAVVEFRTPQHPCLGTNNWGGASPLLARNIPNEALKIRYEMLNSVKTDGDVFTAPHPCDGDFMSYSKREAAKYATKRRVGLSFVVRRLTWRNKRSVTSATLDSTSSRSKRWVGRWDPKNRWPQGWG